MAESNIKVIIFSLWRMFIPSFRALQEIMPALLRAALICYQLLA